MTSEKKQDLLETTGVVEELLPSATFRVKLDNGTNILAYLSGRLRIHRIKILPGDKVKIEMSAYDLSKGRITYRF